MVWLSDLCGGLLNVLVGKVLSMIYNIIHIQEEPNDGKNLDDDEDKKNPAYIPRKGAFYEHDTRLGDEIKEEKEPLV